jgi:hypothetical protein
MSEREHLAYVIENHFSNPDSNVGGTFAPFVVVTDGLTATQAAQSPGERLNSVWAIVNHIAFWQEVTRLGALGQRIVVSDWGLQEMGNGWPPLGAITEANWRAARQRALDGNKAFAQAILSLTDEEFRTRTDPSWGGLVSQAVLSIYGHNCYHTAEILSMRHALKWWANHPWV